MQTRIQSLIEASLNTLSGLVVTMLAQDIIYPFYNIHTTTGQNLSLALIFTVLSIIRSYIWRRLFNRRVSR